MLAEEWHYWRIVNVPWASSISDTSIFTVPRAVLIVAKPPSLTSSTYPLMVSRFVWMVAILVSQSMWTTFEWIASTLVLTDPRVELIVAVLSLRETNPLLIVVGLIWIALKPGYCRLLYPLQCFRWPHFPLLKLDLTGSNWRKLSGFTHGKLRCTRRRNNCNTGILCCWQCCCFCQRALVLFFS